MNITVIIDFEGGRDFVACYEQKIDDSVLHYDPVRFPNCIGGRIGGIINGYLEARLRWDHKSDIEKIMLIEHDKKTKYQGAAPAGKPEKAWGFRKLSNAAGRIVVPVFRPDLMTPRVINEWDDNDDILDGLKEAK